MIAEAGLAALWFAAMLAGLQLLLGVLALRRKDVAGEQAMAAIGPVAIVQGALVAIAMAALIAVFLNTDLSVKLVAENSHSAKPWIYKFAGAWGNHEGSMLLWVTILGAGGALVAWKERTLDRATHVATLAAQGAIALGFYAFLLFASNPFARLNPAPIEGQGLNPLLQDPGLAFHPPTLYAGYVGLSVAFSFAVGALVTGQVGPAFARAMRLWVLGAWVLLTIGITAGSYWAYYELGWGGWWFWDPVENASLMPWLAATALLHSVNVLAARDGLRAWTVMLAVVAFSMSMIGTFLVRSGILTSVHAFAVDPRRGAFILALLGIYIGGALALFGARIGQVRAGRSFAFVSREGGLVVNNLLLSVILGIVLIGTLYPLVAAGFGVRLSVGPPFFHAAAGPIALALVAVMAVGPALRWRSDDAEAVLIRMLWPMVAAAGTFALMLTLTGGMGVLSLLGLSFGVGLIVASVLPITRRNWRRTPLPIWGMVVAHVGLGVSMIGMACDSAFTAERLVALYPGQATIVGPWRVKLDRIYPNVGANWSALEARLTATRDGDGATLRPQQRFFTDPPTTTSESAIATRWDGQLYTVLGQQDAATGRWQLRLWWKPFVTLIWLGGALVALGGVLALVGRWFKAWQQRRREALWG
ncbi:heme lyase CcmF/NrfE family subunit [Sphingomonas sanguinis]|uniref:heme lyase CcmF/NrfE family subunit n=1 Tax=Sphingomonas sanguinis TaxID=33051 RepID=UPI001C59D6AF|nr:heme lyase CcmF/NrfE family subunit [Sphingomonas sanguinis]QXT36913.1 heme lyase CcmF/NrfE family subunit [Sphingomonas sanguinis]